MNYTLGLNRYYTHAGSLNTRKPEEDGAAILAESGNVYIGVCIDTACSKGFCAEHAAVAAMITAVEGQALKIITVGSDSCFKPPCGRCREFIRQIHNEILYM